MLLRYIVSNYKSIGHKIEFSMLPTEEHTDDRFLRTIQTRAGEWKVLRRGGFFGPNASGKSSFISSVAFAKNYICDGRKSGRGTDIPQFKGDFDDLHDISSFQFVFYVDGEVFDYGFSLNSRQICEEWLLQLTSKDFSPVFTRNTDENGVTTIEITSKLGKSNSKERKLAEVLKESIQENQRNQLFLTKLSENGIQKAETVVRWFANIQVIFPESKFVALPVQMKADRNLAHYIAEKLKQLDTGILSADVEAKPIDFDEFVDKNHIPKEILDDINDNNAGIIRLDDNYIIFSHDKQKKKFLIQLKLKHSLNNKVIKFDINDESDGTQRLLDLLPMIFATGHDDSIFFVDEIDRSLHTRLSQQLLSDFIQRVGDGMNQIIFTAHDVNLINLRHFRKDELWFIEKNKLGESTLRPLSDFSIEKGTDTVKAYLSGRFGAVPVIKGGA